MGNRILEYIIRAKDATAAAVSSAKSRLSDFAGNIGGRLGEIADAGDKTARKILAAFTRIPGPVGGIISSIVGSFSGAGAIIVAGIAGWYKAIDGYFTRMAEKSRQTAQIIADNWRNAARGMSEAVRRTFKDIDQDAAALQRKQSNDTAMGRTRRSDNDAKLALQREKELAALMRNGGTTEQAAAMQKRWADEDRYLELKKKELEIEERLSQIRERDSARKRTKDKLKGLLADIGKSVSRAQDDSFKLVQEAAAADGSMWASRRKRLQEQVEDKAGALDARQKAQLQALIAVKDRQTGLAATKENDDALRARLAVEKQTLETRREALGYELANEEAVERKAAAEKEAEAARLAAEKEAEKAAQEELRRQEQLARERERIERELEHERERLAEQAYRKEVQLAQDAVSESARAQSAAQSRLSAADARVAQAWTWYRDNDAMQAHIDDVLAQREAEKRFEKDFERLKGKFLGRGDWRTVDIGKLSAAEEATRQVALAKEEQLAARKSLEAIEANTRDLAQKLDELMGMKE